MKKKNKPMNKEQSRHRAEVIMKVRCGLMTATQAAKELGISRKTYYKWEQRGLEALLGGLEDQPSGRPETMTTTHMPSPAKMMNICLTSVHVTACTPPSIV